MTSSDPSERNERVEFATTHWTQILAARGDSPEAQAALRDLCAAYYHPIQSFIALACHNRSDAMDLTHDFFAQLLTRVGFDQIESNRGRFRTYLLGCVKHFLADVNDKRMAAKRGEGKQPQSLDHASTGTVQGNQEEYIIPIVDPAGFPPDAYFDRWWAMQVLQQALAVLAKEHSAIDREKEFDLLMPFLTGDTPALSHSQLGEKLGTSSEAATMLVHRLRKRFRTAVKVEIAKTIVDGGDLRAELNYLVDALSFALEADQTTEL